MSKLTKGMQIEITGELSSAQKKPVIVNVIEVTGERILVKYNGHVARLEHGQLTRLSSKFKVLYSNCEYRIV